MLHLPDNNTLLEATLIELKQAVDAESPLVVDRVVSDFDHTSFHLLTPDNDNRHVVHLSIATKAWPSLNQCAGAGATPQLIEFIQSKLSSSSSSVTILSQATQGYDLTVSIDLSSLDPQTLHQLSLLKTHVMSFPFHLAFDEFMQLSSSPVPTDPEEPVQRGKLYTIAYRDDENIYIQSSNDRITIIFETIFNDETDKIFGKVFLQEFVDARKRNRSIQSAPQVLSSNVPPREILASMSQQHNNDPDSKRFITFVLFPRHFNTQETQFMTVAKLLQFRNYFHYHIKCSKAFMHSRMRYRVNTFIKVLNRAKFDAEDTEENDNNDKTTTATIERRTFSGRKMVY